MGENAGLEEKFLKPSKGRGEWNNKVGGINSGYIAKEYIN